MPPSTGCLAITSAQVEIVVRRITLPCHHVEHVWFAPAEPACVCESPWLKHFSSKSLNSIHRFIDKLPLILKAASSISNLKGSNSHNKVINEFYGYGEKASISPIIPFVEDNEIFFGRLNIVRVKDQLTVVNIGHKYILPQSNIPHIVWLIYHFRVHMKLQWLSKRPSYPQTCHVDHNIVPVIRSRELSKGSSCCLSCVVDIVCVEYCILALAWNIDLF